MALAIRVTFYLMSAIVFLGMAWISIITFKNTELFWLKIYQPVLGKFVTNQKTQKCIVIFSGFIFACEAIWGLFVLLNKLLSP